MAEGGHEGCDLMYLHLPSADLMYPHPTADQYEVKDVVEDNTSWDEKFVKRA